MIEPGETVDPVTGEVTLLADSAAPAATRPKRRAPAKKAAAIKPRTASLFKSMDLATIDLDTALHLLALPRVVGIDSETGAEITAQNGKFGPYLKKGVDTRSLTTEDQIFEIDLAGAIELYAQPKYGAKRASSALKEFEAPDPESGKAIKIKDGRFGAYVTDGDTNATIPKAESIEEVDFERAVQLLADKRAKGPVVKKTAAKKAPAKKAPAKKAVVKKAVVKKAVVRNAPAKKAAVRKPTASGASATVRKPATPAQKAATAAKAAATRATNAAIKAAAKASAQS